MSLSGRRTGFTLVELLVVTGLIATLLGLVVAGMRPNSGSQVREAVGIFLPAVMKSQATAISNTDGAALILRAESASTAAGLSFAAPQPPIATTLVSGSFNPLFATGTASITVDEPENAVDAMGAYRIRFGQGGVFGPWFRFLPTGVNTSFETSAEVTFDQSLQQTGSNSVLPPSNGSLACQITRFPEETTAVENFPPKLVAIDLRYSGIGDDPQPETFPRFPETATLATLEGKGNIGILFSRTGALESVMPIPLPGSRWITPPARPSAPLYLLVATREDIIASMDSPPKPGPLQNERSTWIAITPETGACLAGKNVAQSSPPPNRDDYPNNWDAYVLAYRTYFQQARANVRPRGFTGSYR